MRAWRQAPHAQAIDDKPEMTSTLARRMDAILDPAVRMAYVSEMIRELPPEELASLVSAALASIPAGSGHGPLLLSISQALCHDEHEDRRTEAARIARDRGEDGAAMLLYPRPPGTPEVGNLRVPDFGKGRPLTLGERKTLARRRDRELLKRVLEDPHADVIALLLRNPALTEADIVRLGAKRPIHSESLERVFRSARWVIRPAVRLALLQNPYTHLDHAIQLVPHVMESDARKLARAPSLRLPIRNFLALRAERPSLH